MYIPIKHSTKAASLTYSAVLFVLSLSLCWWSDVIIDRFSLFGILAYVALIVAYIVCVISSLVSLKKECTANTLLALMILVVILLITVFFPFREVKAYCDYKLHTEKRMKVVTSIVNNCDDLKTGEKLLQSDCNYLSSDGSVYIFKNDEEGAVVAFWVFRGLLSGSFMTIYSNLGENGIRVCIQSQDINIKRFDDYWYYVEAYD